MSNIDWSKIDGGVIAAIISAAAAAVGLIFQRIDIRKQNKYQRETFDYQRRELEKQNKYQRNTFELQNKIEENHLLITVSSELMSNVNMQSQYLARIYMNNHRIVYLQQFQDKNETYKKQLKYEIEELKEYNKITWDAQRKLAENFFKLNNILVVHLINHKERKSIYKMIGTMGDELNDMKAEIDKNDWNENIKTESELSDWSQKRIEAFDIILSPFQKVFIDLKEDTDRRISQIKKEDI